MICPQRIVPDYFSMTISQLIRSLRKFLSLMKKGQFQLNQFSRKKWVIQISAVTQRSSLFFLYLKINKSRKIQVHKIFLKSSWNAWIFRTLNDYKYLISLSQLKKPYQIIELELKVALCLFIVVLHNHQWHF